jgi:hypothetical protein
MYTKKRRRPLKKKTLRVDIKKIKILQEKKTHYKKKH